MTEHPAASHAAAPPGTEPGTSSSSRGALVIAALILLLAVYLTVGLITMDVPDSAQPPGPRFYPLILTVGAYLLAALLALGALRGGSPSARTSAGARGAPTGDTRALLLAIGAFLAFIVILVPLGWLLSATLLFWAIAASIGSTRKLFDLGVSLVVSAAVQVAFSLGLGLNLPPGILGGIF
ncbi:tripartite tricarboxylate transporter TctB family protein [Rothia sp. AR01]|uniref:Tripartite tricarboxylate transporter TctB family protein n=1 Tax=Rothia santali TaxID=2949643 RepID=A0A9X2HH25_9MICC|nr:tripartite tricarboxylate transporter TctB family protein [Rothia santali]MCP3425581.1 tripartite tricarboxylate transporter TctB family protein [Rothia santali]